MEKYHQYERVFNHFDSNRDGRISPAELRHCLVSVSGACITHEEADAAVALMDFDGDGFLRLEDFVTIVEAAGQEEKDKDLKAAFELYQLEGSGCITPESLRKMLRRLGERRTIKECRNMIAAFDLNGDGFLNFHEFKLMMS